MFVQPSQIPKLSNPKTANHTPQQQHENRHREIERQRQGERRTGGVQNSFFCLHSLEVFFFRFLGAGFVEGGFIVVERTYLLLLPLLSCSSNSEALSWPSLLLLLIECSETPAASALSSPTIARELVCDSASERATLVCKKTHTHTQDQGNTLLLNSVFASGPSKLLCQIGHNYCMRIQQQQQQLLWDDSVVLQRRAQMQNPTI
jgi:hypothetical protein